MNKPTLASLDKRVVKVETQLDERWKQMMARIQRVEMVILGSATTYSSNIFWKL